MKTKSKTLKLRAGKVKNSKPDNAITERQRQIILLVLNGHSMREIAFVLDVAVNTVRFDTQKSLKKLGLKTKAELTKSLIDQLKIHAS